MAADLTYRPDWTEDAAHCAECDGEGCDVCCPPTPITEEDRATAYRILGRTEDGYEPERYSGGYDFNDESVPAWERRQAMSVLFGWTDRKSIDKRCDVCHKEYVATGRNRKKSRFCSRKCGNLFNSRRTRARKIAARPMPAAKQCGWCRSGYYPKTKNHKWCSGRCMVRARDERIRQRRGPPPKAKCACGCGRIFSKTKYNREYASRRCGQKIHKRQWLAKQKRQRIRRYQCKNCQKWKLTTNPRKRYCNSACSRMYWHKYKLKGTVWNRRCAWCDASFVAKVFKQSSCCRDHARLYRNARLPHTQKVERECAHCHKTFNTGISRKRYCDRKCRKLGQSVLKGVQIACLFCGKRRRQTCKTNLFCCKKHGNAWRRRQLNPDMKSYMTRNTQKRWHADLSRQVTHQTESQRVQVAEASRRGPRPHFA